MSTATKAGEISGLFDHAFHDVEIKDEGGRSLFHQRNVRAPAGWSERAVRVTASKYLYGDGAKGHDPATGGRERSIFALHARVAQFVAERAIQQGVVQGVAEATTLREDIYAITLGQHAAFNSPVWFNAGLDQYGLLGDDRCYAWDEDLEHGAGAVREVRDTAKYPQCSACFIQSVGDNMESLMTLARNEAMLFKHGSGTGTDFSKVRSKRERLTGGGTPSGPISFMKIFDRIASVVKSGGKTRRAAKMQTMHISHPDILDFITVKGREELKARALIAAGWDSNFNGEAYDTVAFQNANFSVRVDGRFMQALADARFFDDAPRVRPLVWPLVAVTTGEALERVDPRVLWRAIAEETHRCGDPGVQFSHTINDWHTCPYARDGTPTPINSSNPCSEYLFVDDSACNLASINLMKFQDEGGDFDVEKLKHVVRTMIIAMEVLVDASSYPTRQIAQNSHDFRPLGLGFANLGGLLQANGIAYDSDEGRLVAGLLASIICGEAYAASAQLAKKLGPFAGHRINKPFMRTVIDKHQESHVRLLEDAYGRDDDHRPLIRQLEALGDAGSASWEDAVIWGDLYGYRNAQATVIAPTGTISFMMDCDTTGIEPNIALRAWKTLAGGGGMWVVNGLVPRALKALGYSYDRPDAHRPSMIDLIMDHLEVHGSLEDSMIFDDDLPVFDCALAPPGSTRVLRPEAHLLMMAAVQPFVSGAISKTVNVPADSTVEQIEAIYLEAERLGVKCVAIYRDGSKSSQPLNAKANAGRKLECKKCGSINLVPTGTCGICAECGEPTGGCE